MRKEFSKLALFAATAAVAFSGGAAWAADSASAKEAEAMVKKAVSYIKANGKDKGYAEITNKQGQFVDRDLYLVALQTDGKVSAHGANEKLVGKVLLELKDVDGKEFVREIIEAAKSKNGSWTDFKYSHPLTKKVEPKSLYCERLDESALVCGGIYKL
ncbi:MAG: cache domain-containing protein [Betaproteobacteria bacterium]|nr:cache domain-containing protein [Betaproteobacteria bacterium]